MSLQGWVDMYKGIEVRKRISQLRHNTRYRVRVKVSGGVSLEATLDTDRPYDDIFSMLSLHKVSTKPWGVVAPG